MIPFFQFSSFSLGPLVVHVWGLALAAAFGIGLVVALREVKRRRLLTAPIFDLGWIIPLAALVGARLFYVANEWNVFSQTPENTWRVWDGGLAFYGGLMGAALAGAIYLRLKKLSLGAYADCVAVALPLGLAIGRVGCWLTHDHVGKITSVPWALTWPDGVSRHEVALYEILFCAALWLVVYHLRKSATITRFPGALFLMFIFSYSVFRLLADNYRATDLIGSDPTVWLGLRPSQWTAIVLIIASAVGGWFGANKTRHISPMTG